MKVDASGRRIPDHDALMVPEAPTSEKSDIITLLIRREFYLRKITYRLFEGQCYCTFPTDKKRREVYRQIGGVVRVNNKNLSWDQFIDACKILGIAPTLTINCPKQVGYQKSYTVSPLTKEFIFEKAERIPDGVFEIKDGSFKEV
jgi:hypothetical protein